MGIVKADMEPTFFAKAEDWREWLERHHRQSRELLVGFYKKASGRPSMTWPEAVDGALCFGWIDGVRRRIDDVSYSIRFTPRRSRSTWSAVNIKRVAELLGQGLMRPSGVEAFGARQDDRSCIYSFEQEHIQFDSTQEAQFCSNEIAWKFFRAQAPSYQRAAIWWIVTGKRQQTKDRRLIKLIEASVSQRRINQ